ncbi:MAG: sensor histidine kinase [Thermoanaerobaculia bacterium]
MHRNLTLVSRADRVVAVARVVLGFASLAAVWVDPSEPAKFTPFTYGVILLYSLYAGGVAFFAFRTPRQVTFWPMTSHVIDVAVFSLLAYLTEGPTSPFFLYFVFALFCATIRFDVRTTLWTAAAAIIVFVGLGMWAAHVLKDPVFYSNRFIVRGVYLVVLASLVVYQARYQASIRADLSGIAAWPVAAGFSEKEAVRDGLARIAGILRSPRVAAYWERPGERQLAIGRKEAGEFQCVHAFSDAADCFADTARGWRNFVAATPGPILVQQMDGEIVWTDNHPLTEEARATLSAATLLATTFVGETVRGRLFVCDRRDLASDDLVLAEIVGALFARNLDQVHHATLVTSSAVTEERFRLGRDLHDSLLQSLTGAALQLQSVQRMMIRDPEGAQVRLGEVQSALARDQRELRGVVEALQSPDEATLPARLPDRLAGLVDRFRESWGLGVVMNVDPAVVLAPAIIQHEIYGLVSEAVANAARHAEASAVTVTVAVISDRIEIGIGDDGRGFSFQGTYRLVDLIRMRRGPVTLKERVISLGGDMTLDSSGTGARLEITLPLRRDGART